MRKIWRTLERHDSGPGKTWSTVSCSIIFPSYSSPILRYSGSLRMQDRTKDRVYIGHQGTLSTPWMDGARVLGPYVLQSPFPGFGELPPKERTVSTMDKRRIS